MTNNNDLDKLFSIVENNTPWYQLETEDMLNYKFFFSLIEGTSYEVPLSKVFNCWTDKLLIERNIKLLEKYKMSLKQKLDIHVSLDKEVEQLMVLACKNKLEIDKRMKVISPQI
jgi:hypothetical protein